MLIAYFGFETQIPLFLLKLPRKSGKVSYLPTFVIFARYEIKSFNIEISLRRTCTAQGLFL